MRIINIKIEKLNICPECYNNKFKEANEGYYYCSKCGLLVETPEPVFNKEQFNKNYLKDLENLEKYLEKRRVNKMFNAYENGIKYKVDKRIRPNNKRQMAIKELSRELREHNYILGQNKEIIKVENGKATAVEKDFIISLLENIDKLNSNPITEFEIAILKSELYYIPNINLINEEILKEPLTNIPRLKLRIIEHNKKQEKLAVTNMGDAHINDLINYNFFISDNQLFRLNSDLINYGSLNEKNKISFHDHNKKINISYNPTYKELLKEKLLDIPKNKVDLVFKEYDRIRNLEEQNNLLSIFHNT